MADPKQTSTPAANTNQQTPSADKAVKQPNTPDYTKVTDSGNAWEDEAKAVREAGASQEGGNPASLVNNVDDSQDVGTTSDTHKYTFTDTGDVVEANSLAEAMSQLENKNKEGNK